MGNDEVIINGVNVTECEFLDKYKVCKAYVYMPKPCGCENNPNCYFKQLQREKAEKGPIMKLTEDEKVAQQTFWRDIAPHPKISKDTDKEKEILEKVNEMFEQVIIKAKFNYDYNYFKYTQDILDIWDYVREQLGKPKFQRIVDDEYKEE